MPGKTEFLLFCVKCDTCLPMLPSSFVVVVGFLAQKKNRTLQTPTPKCNLRGPWKVGGTEGNEKQTLLLSSDR